MARIITMAEANTVAATGLVGEEIPMGLVPFQTGGPGSVGEGTVWLDITKTAGGNIDSAVDTLKFLVSHDSVEWFDVYQTFGDTDPVNYFIGCDGKTELKRSYPIKLFPFMKVSLIGDGSTDTYTINSNIAITII